MHTIKQKDLHDCCTIESMDCETTGQLKNVLWIVFALNLGMFFIEFYFGIDARSSSLLADSLDMFADAFVYGLSLFVLTQNHYRQASASMFKGITMMALGFFVLTENLSKMVYPVIPDGMTISAVGLLALAVNILCVVLLLKFKDKTLNVKSAWLCSRNDAFGNVVVIVAGLLVSTFSSQLPDILIGFVLSFVVLKSSIQIIVSSRRELIYHKYH